MSIGLAKRKLVFEDSDNSGDKPCMKKRVTRSMEVTILVAKRHMHIIEQMSVFLFFYYIHTQYVTCNINY